MKDAPEKLDGTIRQMRDRARVLSAADCQGDATMVADIQTGLRAAASELDLRGGYLKLPPWSFVRADKPEGAREFLAGARSRPLADQDLVTQYLLRTHEEALVTVSEGNPCPASLSEEVQVYADTPLDESAGEGYHRGTHLTRIRARRENAISQTSSKNQGEY